MTTEMVERDLGWDRIRREIGEAERAGVKVGVLSDSASEQIDGADLLLVASANEFGTADGRIPARPFVRGAFDQKRRDLFRIQTRLWSQVLQGRMTTRQALGLMGETHQGQVQAYITALDTPANAPSTVAQKGSSNPLENEGRLRNSIRWEHDR